MLRYSSALVTGGAHGIGRAIATTLAAEGLAVVILDVDGAAAEETARAIARRGGRCTAVEADLCRVEQLESAMSKVESDLGGPAEIVINNAGVVISGQFADTTPADSMAQLGVNLIAPIRVVHLVLPEMLARGKGHIVNVASAGGLVPFPGIAVYTATKFGLVGFSEALRSELAGTGVNVSVVCPGVIRTGIAERSGFRGVPRERLEHLMSIGVPPQRVARATLRAIRRNYPVTVVTAPARVSVLLYRHFPRSFRRLAALIGGIQRREIAAARRAGGDT